MRRAPRSPIPIYSKWFDVYHTQKSGVQINYQSIGSGGGNSPAPGRHRGFRRVRRPHERRTTGQVKFKILHFPTVLGADVPTYNIPGVSAELNFTQKALAGIYLGTITKWNDAEIAKANPGVNLPQFRHRRGAPVGRQRDDLHLDRLPLQGQRRLERTKSASGTSVNWPVGLGGKGNEGVAGLVKQTPDSIGYVELIYAIQNQHALRQGEERRREISSRRDLAGRDCGGEWCVRRRCRNDFRVSITNAPGAEAYPISSFTWLLIPAQIQDASKRDAIKNFLKLDAEGGTGLQ